MLKKIAFSMSMFLFIAKGMSSMSQTQTIVSVGGDWSITFSVGDRESSAILTIKQDGEKIKVVISYSSSGERTGSGYVKGEEIEWTEIIENVGEKVSVVSDGKIEQKTAKKDTSQEYIYKGKIEGDVINGYAFPKNNEAKRFDWKAVRKAK